ncbi:DivIVA domain-containing protein [Terrabacter sp. BE26]|uniref:DivIVA domain-containing protein n=1 Tax=Terrabacter sp. BE26 TaxID=2898152 RepID=UPI0035BE9E28
MDSTGRATLADELRRARFRTTQFREGYSEPAVDDLLDAVVQQLVSPEAGSRSDADVVAMVDAARLPITKARRGYAQADVDALLSRLVTGLGGTRTAEPPPGADGRSVTTTEAAPSLPSAVTEPPRGLLARLFGR